MSRQAKFLGVYGEPVSLMNRLITIENEDHIKLKPFAQEDWRCIVPQGLDGANITFKHYGNDAALVGYKMVAPNVSVYFVGANLAYHGFLTHDTVSAGILEDIMKLEPKYQKPVINRFTYYRTDREGYTLGYRAIHPFKAIIPVAALDGMRAELDGKDLPIGVYENMITANLPAGQHRIVLRLEEAPEYEWGRIISLSSLAVLIIILLARSLVLRKRRQINHSI